MILRAAGLTRVFENGFAALGPIDLEIARGELVGILGPSGSGKSTLLRLLAGLDRPSGGGLAHPEGGLKIATVFQQPRLMPWLSVAENVAFGLFDLPAGVRDHRVGQVLARVGLSEFADALPKTLSGGMAQRVGVARALALEPDLLLMDEPFGALDPLTRLRLQQHVADLLSRAGPAVILITHDVEEALLLADRVIVLDGPPGRIRTEERVTLPRPRHADDARFVALRSRLLGALDVAA